MSDSVEVVAEPSRPAFNLAVFEAIVALLGGLRHVTSEDEESQVQATLERLDPRWTAEAWAEVRHRLAPGRSPEQGGLNDGVAYTVAQFGPSVITDAARERARRRMAEASARHSPEAQERLRQALGVESLPEPDPKAAARADEMIAEAMRRSGLYNETIRIDSETRRKLMTLAIRGRASLSETVTDLVDDAYEQQEWSERRAIQRHRAKSEKLARRRNDLDGNLPSD
jgi:hypothetical protein